MSEQQPQQEVSLELLKQFRPLDSISDNSLNELIPYCSCVQLSSGKIIFKRGQENHNFYCLLDGSLDLLDGNYQVEKLNIQHEKAQSTIDNNNPYEYTAVTTSDVTLLKIDKDRLDLVITWDQAGNYLVEDIDSNREIYKGDWMSCLLGSKLFQQLPPANLQQLFVKFSEKPVKAKEKIISEGDQGKTFYVIQQGSASVIRADESGNEKRLARLGPGSYFGEEALIGDTVRNATIIMDKDGILMELGKEDFKKLLEEPVVHYITKTNLQEWQSEGRTIKELDVRLPVEVPPVERKSRMIIALSELRTSLSTLNEDTTYILCPEGGRRSVLGAYLLNEAGFNAVILK